jgi:hypothetical protein
MGLVLCNSYPTTIWTSIMFYSPETCGGDGDDFEMMGWWGLTPGSRPDRSLPRLAGHQSRRTRGTQGTAQGDLREIQDQRPGSVRQGVRVYPAVLLGVSPCCTVLNLSAQPLSCPTEPAAPNTFTPLDRLRGSQKASLWRWRAIGPGLSAFLVAAQKLPLSWLIQFSGRTA